MPWDRRWAVAHEALPGRWQRLGALRELLARGQGAALMAINAQGD